MKLKEFKPKYDDLEIYVGNRNSGGLFDAPYKEKYDLALKNYAEKEILDYQDNDDKKCTEIFLD